LINFLEERDWRILNGCKKGDQEGEYTFIGGNGNTIIDYIIGDEEVREKVSKFRGRNGFGSSPGGGLDKRNGTKDKEV